MRIGADRPAVLFAISIGVALQGCDVTRGEIARVDVVINGLTTRDDVVQISLVPGSYDFVATGIANAGGADITLTVLDRDAVQITTIQLSLTLAEAEAMPGDTGSGARTGVLVVEGAQSVTIEFHWQAETPVADVTVDMSFFDNPDISDWDADPPAPVQPSTVVRVWVKATNNEGTREELRVDAQFIDESDGSVIRTVTLGFAGDDLFTGELDAPEAPGAHRLRIVATDNTGGITQHERTFSVQ